MYHDRRRHAPVSRVSLVAGGRPQRLAHAGRPDVRERRSRASTRTASCVEALQDWGISIAGRSCTGQGLPMTTLPGLCSSVYALPWSAAYAVNNSGWVVGGSRTCSGDYHATIWKVRVVASPILTVPPVSVSPAPPRTAPPQRSDVVTCREPMVVPTVARAHGAFRTRTLRRFGRLAVRRPGRTGSECPRRCG